MLKKLAKTLVLLLAVLPFTSSADRGQYREYETTGDWFSTIFHVNNTEYVRMGTPSRRTKNASFVIDATRDSSLMQIIIVKTGDEIGDITSSSPIEDNCELRVDTNPVFYSKCLISEDNLGMYITFDAGRLGDRFIEELKSGSVLRTRMGNDSQSVYDNFSLNGFSRAYDRAGILATEISASGSGSDSDYFR